MFESLMKKHYFIFPFVNLFLAALLGLLLRAIYVFPDLEFNFLYIMHGHSHVAMLGWVYMMIYLLFIWFFALKTGKDNQFYKKLFWITQIAVFGMLVFFPIQGYAAASIGFSTLHILCSYAFVIRLWKKNKAKRGMERLLLKTSLTFMVLSTLGVWCLGPAVGLLGKTSAFYQIAIQFFLHFQFNGWFLFALLTLFVHILYRDKVPKNTKWLYASLVLSVFLTFALPLSWYLDFSFLHVVNGIGAAIQFGVFAIFILNGTQTVKPSVKKSEWTVRWVKWFALLSLALRFLFQLFTLSVAIAEHAHVIRHWTVGFIHLNMVGVFSGFFVWILLSEKIMRINLSLKMGAVFFFGAYVLTELVLFGEGLFVFLNQQSPLSVHVALFWVSVGLPLGVLLMLLPMFKSAKKMFVYE